MISRVGFYCAALLLWLALSSAANAACPEIPTIARTPSAGSPFAPDNRDVTRMDTQTSDNVRITGGCIDPPVVGLTTVSAKLSGAKGDRIDVTSGVAITTGTKTLSVPGASFTTADVGKIIIVSGAGASGHALLTTIAAFIDVTHVTLADAASTTVSNASVEYATNDVTAIVTAITAAAALPTGGRVLLPAGKYIINPAISQVALASNVTLDGESAVDIRCASLLDSATPRLSACIQGVSLSNVAVKNLAIKGMADVTPTLFSSTTAPIYTNTSSNVTISGVTVSYSRSYSISVNAGDQIAIKDNKISYSMSNAISCGECGTVVITGNHIDHASDAAIATSTGDSIAAPSGGRSVVIANNSITESIGVQVSGGRSITIANNSFVRAIGQAMYVDRFTSFDSGDTATSAVNVAGNTVLDVLNHDPGSPLVTSYNAYLVIGGGQRQAGGGDSIPGYPTVTTGVVTDLYGTDTTGNFFANDTDDSGVASPGSIGWNISNNVFIRTLPEVASYSQWGYGAGMWLGVKTAGTPYTGAIVEADLQIPCIVVDFPLRLSKIAGNICATTGEYGVNVRPTAPVIGDFDGLEITDNNIYDFTTAGIVFGAASASSSQVSILRNSFNADPRFLSANRGTGGTWAANAAPFGISSGTMSGLYIDGNHYRNLSNPYNFGAGPASATTGKNETIYGIPAAAGFSTSNIGVGAVSGISGAKNLFNLVCEDGDPRNATFGTITSVTGQISAAMPAAGCWLRGTFVSITVPTTDSTGRVLLGWMRLTTGTANVSGADWKAVYSGATVTTTPFFTPSNPTGTTSTTAVMMGLGGTATITPVFSTKASVVVTGVCSNDTINDGGAFSIRWNSGSAPTNGAAVTGNGGSEIIYWVAAAAQLMPCSQTLLMTGLTPGVTYWLDIALRARTGGTATVVNISISAVEL